ncbi:dethiobiotin synthase [Actinophytocola sediminis]
MSVIVLTGTGTGVGKTVVTAAVAALALDRRRSVAVLKPAQTGLGPGEPGDVDDVSRLVGDDVTTWELARFTEPLAPGTAARRAGILPVTPSQAAAAAVELSRGHDQVLIEGAGGLLVPMDDNGGTLADVAWSIGAPVLIVADAGLGTLNATALTAEVLRRRGVECLGVVVGSWPADPDLAARCNLDDLPVVADAPLLGAVPEHAGTLRRDRFLAVARSALAPALGGEFDATGFAAAHVA